MNKITKNGTYKFATVSVIAICLLIANPFSALAYYGYSYDPAYSYNSSNYLPLPTQTVVVPVVQPVVYQPVPVYPALNVYCSTNSNYALVGSQVSWSAYASGGNGSYSYTWSGTDNIGGYGQTIWASYAYPGQKSASVTVYSAGQSVTRYCGTVNVTAPIIVQPIVQAIPVAAPIIQAVPVMNVAPVQAPSNFTYSAPAKKAATPVKTSAPLKKTIPAANTSTEVHVQVDVKTQSGSNGSSVIVNGNKVNTDSSKPVQSQSPTIELESKTAGLASSPLFSLANVPWGWVMILVILVLFFTVVYLLANNKKV